MPTTPRTQVGHATPILLGSASPRRRDILHGLGLPFVVRPTEIDETLRQGDSPASYVTRVVADKLEAALGNQGVDQFACVLVADTIVVLGDHILGKPRDTADAEALVGALCGRTHRVLTRFAFSTPLSARDGKSSQRNVHALTVESLVTLRSASPDEVARYARTGEGADKAGGYAVQGLGAFLVSRIEGSYSNVVGLPACELVQALDQAGLLAAFPYARG